MIEEAIGKVIGMAMAYIVSSVGLLLAYYNYRKRIVKAERVFTPAAWLVIILVAGITVAGVVWLILRKPVETYACACVQVVNKTGVPLQGALVYAEGVSYAGNFESRRTDADGRACITVKNSAAAANTVNFFAKVRNEIAAYPDNPVATPQDPASCVLKIDCPGKCAQLGKTLRLNVDDTRWDPSAFADLAYENKVRSETKTLGIVLPILIFAFSFFVTWLLYKHFSKKVEDEKLGEK